MYPGNKKANLKIATITPIHVRVIVSLSFTLTCYASLFVGFIQRKIKNIL
jgi:hypothetical protein